jgi:hypothetical protein
MTHDTSTTDIGVGTIEKNIEHLLQQTNQIPIRCLGDGHCLRRAIAKRLEIEPGHLIKLLIALGQKLTQQQPSGLNNTSHTCTYTPNEANNIQEAIKKYIKKIKKFGASEFVEDNKTKFTNYWGTDLEIRLTAILVGKPIIVLTNHCNPNKLVNIQWPSIETRAWCSNNNQHMTVIHETLIKHYKEVIYILYNNSNHYNAVIPKELQHADPRRPPMQIKFPHLPTTKQLQQYLAESQITSTLSLSLDLLTDTTQHRITFPKLDSTPNTPAEGCVGSSSLSLRSAQEGECTNETYRPKKRTRRMLSLADSDDSDDELSSENTMQSCVVSVRRSDDNESADVICDSARFCCSCSKENKTNAIQKYLENKHNETPQNEGICFKTTIKDIKNHARIKRRHKPTSQVQTQQNSVDLTNSPPSKNKKRKIRIIYDTSSDEEAITTTHKKKRRKKETKTETKETPIDLAIDIRKSGMLSTSDQGWNSTQGRRIHIPNQ